MSAKSIVSPPLSKKVAQTVHIECESETQCLVQRRSLCRGHHVRCIEAHHVQRKACAHTEILPVAFEFILVVISGTQEKLVVVGVFGTEAHCNLTQLFLEASGSIAETLEDAGNGAHVAPVLEFGYVFLLAFDTVGEVAPAGFRRHKKLVKIQRESQCVVVGEREHESCTQFEIRGQESGILAAVIAHLCAYVGNIPTPRPLAFVAPDDGIGGIISGNIGRESGGACVLVAGIGFGESQRGINVTENDTHGEFLGQLAGITHVERHLIGVDCLPVDATFLGSVHLTQ